MLGRAGAARLWPASSLSLLARRLDREGRPVVLVDVAKRPDLARKYGVSLVPLAFTVDGDGTILARVA